MADESEDQSPAVELGDGPAVAGAPVARVASRLTWPIEKGEIERQEGDTVVRTPDGAQELSTLLDSVEVTYFERRQQFLSAIEDVVGAGPVATGE